MAAASHCVAAFAGPVQCRVQAAAAPVSAAGSAQAPALYLTLSGRAADRSGEIMRLTCACVGPLELPHVLDAALLEQTSDGFYRLRGDGRAWDLGAARIHLHRDVSAAFRAAIPPQPAPRLRRLLWDLILALAASPPGRRLLARRSSRPAPP